MNLVVTVRLGVHVYIIVGHLRLKPSALEDRMAEPAAKLALAARLGKGVLDALS
jgi:hypothetical protein